MNTLNNKQFKTPYGFFEKQRGEILAATSHKNHVFMGHIIKRSYAIQTLAMAASLTGIVILSTLWMNKSNNECDSFACLLESTNFNDLSQEDYKNLEACCSFNRQTITFD